MENIINIENVTFVPRPAAFAPQGEAAQKYSAEIAMISGSLGAEKLGYNLTRIPAGKRAYPFHSHRVNEEMFLILKGKGELRFGGALHPIRQGDIIACPPGGKTKAHQIVNTASEELLYLAVSTKISPEIAEYPDSGKFGILAEFSGDGAEPPHLFMHVGKAEQSLDYWEGN